jgi:hypothetical protein
LASQPHVRVGTTGTHPENDKLSSYY